MKKIHHKPKSLGFSFTLIILLFLFFSSWSHAHANEPLYLEDGFWISTSTRAGGSPTTYFGFIILDANGYDLPPLENVVESATITYPDGITQESFTPDLYRWAHMEFQGRDNNPRNGIIEPYHGEYESGISSGVEYEMISSVSPHKAGPYLLEVTCTNGQTLFDMRTLDYAGMTLADLPPVTNVKASFDPGSGLFQVSWDLPTTGYEPEATIQIRVAIFEKDGGSRYFRYRVRNLPANQLTYTFLKWESDNLRLYVPYIRVRVRTYMRANNSMAESEVKYYAIDGTDLTPTTITRIDEPATLSNNLRTLYVPYLDYKGNLLWMELHHYGCRRHKAAIDRCLQEGNCSPRILRRLKYRIKGVGPAR